MRKNILITTMLLIAFAANAQPPSFEKHIEAYYNGVITKTILRHYSDIYMVGYVETTNGNYFFQTDTGMVTFREFGIPINYTVTDFEIY